VFVKIVKITPTEIIVQFHEMGGGFETFIRFDATGTAVDSRDIYEGAWTNKDGLPGMPDGYPWEMTETEVEVDERARKLSKPVKDATTLVVGQHVFMSDGILCEGTVTEVTETGVTVEVDPRYERRDKFIHFDKNGRRANSGLSLYLDPQNETLNL
jgi:hypothetical protein